jgi:hypothetical protein
MGRLVEVCETYRLETGRERMSNDSKRILAAVRAFSEGMVSEPTKEPNLGRESHLPLECAYCGSKRFYPNEFPCTRCIEETKKQRNK